MISKINLRKNFLKKINSFYPSKKELYNLYSYLKPILENFKIWGSYKKLAGEVDLEDITKTVNCQFAYPKIKSDGVMKYFLNSKEINPDALLIPGLAFDKYGYRLGRGGGYFDRFLKNYNNKKVAIAFYNQIYKSALPREDHDEKVDIIVTEKGLIKIG